MSLGEVEGDRLLRGNRIRGDVNMEVFVKLEAFVRRYAEI